MLQLHAFELLCLVVAATASGLVDPSVQKFSFVICEGASGSFKCPPNTLIEVYSAFYGRTTNDYCPFGPIHSYSCTQPRALSIAASRCNNRQDCQLATATFGDPCVGTTKYLLVSYTCREMPIASACDGSSLQIQCPAGHYIHVRDGFYGRVSDEYCAQGPRPNYNCRQPAARDIITKKCDNSQACELRLDGSELGDPCVGTYKYATAGYECIDHQFTVACDGQSTSITCSPGTLIRVVGAFVGRTSDEFCAHGPRLTYECSAPGAHQAAVSLCHNRQTCSFGGLPVPDPCGGTLKVTIVRYRCL